MVASGVAAGSPSIGLLSTMDQLWHTPGVPTTGRDHVKAGWCQPHPAWQAITVVRDRPGRHHGTMRTESSVTSLSWIPSEAVTRQHPGGLRCRVHPLRRAAARRHRGHRGPPAGRPVPLRQRALRLPRVRRRRHHHRLRLHRRWPDGLDHGGGGRPQPGVRGRGPTRHPAAPGGGRRLGPVRPDVRRPHRAARPRAGCAASPSSSGRRPWSGPPCS